MILYSYVLKLMRSYSLTFNVGMRIGPTTSALDGNAAASCGKVR